MVYVTSQPTAVWAETMIQTWRKYGVFAQVTDETRTFYRYVNLCMAEQMFYNVHNLKLVFIDRLQVIYKQFNIMSP